MGFFSCQVTTDTRMKYLLTIHASCFYLQEVDLYLVHKNWKSHEKYFLKNLDVDYYNYKGVLDSY
jgi:hypothetical protein